MIASRGVLSMTVTKMYNPASHAIGANCLFFVTVCVHYAVLNLGDAHYLLKLK